MAHPSEVLSFRMVYFLSVVHKDNFFIVEFAVSKRTSTRWMKPLGLKYRNVQKGMYFGGRKREDIKAYRAKILAEMAEPLMPVMNMIEKSSITWVTLQPGQRR